MNYPNAIKFGSIRRDKRICDKCKKPIYGLSDTMIITTGRGRYICHRCDPDEPNEFEEIE